MTIPQYPTSPSTLPPNQNIIANPSSVTPGSSTEAPPSYPDNPMDAARTNDDIARGRPATPDYFSQGVVLMVVCPTPSCGRAINPAELGLHVQQHAAEADRSALGRGGDFGNNYEV